MCVCVVTFPRRAGARFINPKHEPMDPITPLRCVFTQQCEEQRETGGRDRRTQAYPSPWTLVLKYPHPSETFFPHSSSSCLCNNGGPKKGFW